MIIFVESSKWGYEVKALDHVLHFKVIRRRKSNGSTLRYTRGPQYFIITNSIIPL